MKTCTKCGEELIPPNSIWCPNCDCTPMTHPTPTPLSNTPETDAQRKFAHTNEGPTLVLYDFARKLERERDEARAKIDEQGRGIMDAAHRLARAEQERDSLQSQLSQREIQLKDTIAERDQYKTWGEREIALLKSNLEESIRQHERMADQLSVLRKDKELWDWMDNVKNYTKVCLLLREMDKSGNFIKWRDAVKAAIQSSKPA